MAKTVLVVLVLREAALRSMLAAQLVGAGANLLSATDAAELVERGMIRHPCLLVVDAAEIGDDPKEWLDRQWRQGAWTHVVVLTPAAVPPQSGAAWLDHVPHAGAAAALGVLLRNWPHAPRV